MAWMKKASKAQVFSGNRQKAPINKVVVHSTEGSGWPGYNGGKNAPHMTINLQTGAIRQHIDSALSSKALVNRPGGVETNNNGVFQIELIGSCDRAWAKKHNIFFLPDANDKQLGVLAEVLAWVHKTHGVPLTTRGLSWPDTNAAYLTAPQRMSYKAWNNFSGVCGHTHVPENDHWDPGKTDVPRAVELAKKLVGGGSIPSAGTSTPPPKPTKAPAFPLPRRPGAMYYYGPKDGPKNSVSGMGLNTAVPADVVKVNGRWRSKGLASAQARLIARGWNELRSAGGADGRYGAVTEKVIGQFQSSMGLPVDRKLGPDTWKAIWETPVK